MSARSAVSILTPARSMSASTSTSGSSIVRVDRRRGPRRRGAARSGSARRSDHVGVLAPRRAAVGIGRRRPPPRSVGARRLRPLAQELDGEVVERVRAPARVQEVGGDAARRSPGLAAARPARASTTRSRLACAESLRTRRVLEERPQAPSSAAGGDAPPGTSSREWPSGT